MAMLTTEGPGDYLQEQEQERDADHDRDYRPADAPYAEPNTG
jgi:hypothetical protein